MEDNTINKKRKTWLIVFGVVAVLALVALSIWLTISNNSYDEAEPEYSDGEIVGDTQDKFMVFYNLDFLTMAYNIKFSTNVASDIEKYAFLPEEMKFAGENNSKNGNNSVYYDATIDVGNIVNYDALTSRFDVSISDGRKYGILTRTDSIEENYTYLYVAITRDGSDSIGIFVSGDNSLENEFAEFAKEQFGKNTVTTIGSE